MKTGIWLIGARGSIATVTMAGHAAVVRGLAPMTGFVSNREVFNGADLPPLEGFIFGGHELRRMSLKEVTSATLDACGVRRYPRAFEAELDAKLDAIDEDIRPGIALRVGPQVDSVANDIRAVATEREAIDAVRLDLDAFKAKHGLRRLVMINLASTEPSVSPKASWTSLAALEAALTVNESGLPSSSLYAYAALAGGDAYINFTPSLGSRLPALEELALTRGAVHGGSDGKTGETLIKSVLAELFARRNLEILSWFGQNILGNEDGRVLDDPTHKATKIRSKDHLLPKILGYAPQTRVGIDYVESLGEWKIAWDHIHFAGFLGGRMSMQFTWSGCDSLLAAPLVLDLARFAALAQRREERGLLTALSSFFKDPMGVDEQRLVAQDEELVRWALGEPR